MRVYPAYGRTIAAHVVRGLKPVCVGVLLSDGFWHHFNHAPKVCIKAAEWELGRWEFGFLRGLHVVAIWGDCTEKQFGELLVELMRIGPARLSAYDLTGKALTSEQADEDAIAYWVHHLGAFRLFDPPLRDARKACRLSILDANIREYEEVLKIAERSGGDAAIRWRAQQDENRERVRRMFSAPFQEASEPAAV